jgi:hypothetical protein
MQIARNPYPFVCALLSSDSHRFGYALDSQHEYEPNHSGCKSETCEEEPHGLVKSRQNLKASTGGQTPNSLTI